MVDKLTDASADVDTIAKWNSIGIYNVNDMITHIISELNNKNPKFAITSTRIESGATIKSRVENSGNVSKFAGYFENEKGNIDALFFYIEPNVGSANDFLSRYVIPVVLGIYKSIENRTSDMHVNNMPVYIVSICSTSRVGNNSVKKNIVLAETMGFQYLDIFNNSYYDVIGRVDANGDPVTKIRTLQELDDFLKDGGVNEYFTVDTTINSLIIHSDILDRSSNPSAELYRYVLRIIPAVYMASYDGYNIDVTSLATSTAESVILLKRYLESF
ncbi:hypothetical protein QTL86_06525 [Cellulosilyticum sp. ST5]|uniref:hypothetical protein n=1 Tax=Cellulosilyticum sp. ST5 TaxID=3055805 RepID=UPI0039773F29